MNYMLTEKALTLFSGGQIHTIHRDDRRWGHALELLQAHDEESLVDLLRPLLKLVRYVSASGNLTINSGQVMYKGEELPKEEYFIKKLVSMSQEGYPLDPLVNFIERLLLNPSKHAQSELLQFLEYGDLPITYDGYFLAYKRVRADYKDVHSGVNDNSVGSIVEMPRHNVDADSTRTCSSGLHFASREYIKHFMGERLVILKIDPADVVSIPVDYHNTKGRCCKYQVVSELELNPDELNDNVWNNAPVVGVEPNGGVDPDDELDFAEEFDYQEDETEED